MKKRYFVIPAALVLLAMSFGFPSWLKPVRPFIQLPGEAYVGTEYWFGGAGWTNTFTSTLVVWAIVIIITLSLRARSRTADEVPTGFYNFFEMVIEGAYSFTENIAGSEKAKVFFKFFMTYVLVILTANWLGLFPGVDSIGLWENKASFEGIQTEKAVVAELEELYAEQGQEAVNARIAELNVEYHLDEDHALEFANGTLVNSQKGEIYKAVKKEVDKKNKGDLQRGIWLLRAYEDDSGYKPEDADWTIVPFLRPAATDLNFTLAYAIVAMVLVYFQGIRYLGAREFFGKYFPFILPTFGRDVAENPINAVNVVVGLLEFVGDISKIISFAFRLLGNLFAGMVLLFVMAFLAPVANIAFFGLEFFVGLIQAIVFGLLMLIFMVGAAESHHGDHGHDDHH